MNFQDLLSKMKNLDESADVVSVDECGLPGMANMPSGMMGMSSPKQSDSVTMNVSMNGSGAGGIRDLMGILKNIEDAGVDHDHHGDDEIVIGGPLDAKMADLEDSYANEPHPVTAGSNIVTGDDLASKGGEAEKVNGGGNPMGVDEALVQRLASHYESIKEASHQEKTTMKHVKNPTAAEKKAAGDIKAGTAGYKDRIDMLKSAEKDGRLKD